MCDRTISEIHFEELCANRGILCECIPESIEKSADYRVSLGSTTLITEVKQLNPNDEGRELGEVWGTSKSPGAVAPSGRVQGLLDDGYSQVKRSSEGKWATMIVVYNNSGEWNWIDTFTVTKAMFGKYGIVLGSRPDKTMDEIGRGYLGKRVKAYFCKRVVDVGALAKLADAQYIHTNPRDRGFVQWEPEQI